MSILMVLVLMAQIFMNNFFKIGDEYEFYVKCPDDVSGPLNIWCGDVHDFGEIRFNPGFYFGLTIS